MIPYRKPTRTYSQDADNTETAFIAKRRKIVATSAKLQSVETVKRSATAAAHAMIEASTSVQHEIVFQKSKQYKNQVQAYLDGHLLESEIPEDMLVVVKAHLAKQHKTDMDRTKQETRKHKLMATAPPDIKRQPIYLADESWARELHGLRFVPCADAKVFAVRNPSQPGQRVSWVVSLVGGSVCDFNFLKRSAGDNSDGGSRGRGVVFTYDAAIVTKRKMFICPKFASAHPVLAGIVRTAVSRRESKWTLLDSWEAFAQATEVACGPNVTKRQKRRFDVLALTVPEVSKSLDLGNVFVKCKFLKFVTHVACASRGMCKT